MTQTIKKNLRLILAALALVLLAVGFLMIYIRFRPKPVAGSKTITVTVTHGDATVREWHLTTDEEYLRPAVEEPLGLKGEQSTYGLYIKVIDGERADYDLDNAYWSIYVDGEYSNYGADSLVLRDGGKYDFIYTLVR